ncbi:MAG: hypothetical protein IPL46_09260 [Saprospiraceae bacterium]|nr:hypothetical protein [Saprospiraceae bacterium]
MQSIRLLLFNAFILWISTVNTVLSQSFGGFKPSISWSQINTDTVRIIFPNYLQEQAQRVANAIHYLNKYQVNEIGDKAFKIDIVLNNQSTISNGFVSIAPWKSHLITTPLQDSYQLTALPWLDLLALHEYRHVIQLSSARRGITNVLYYLFGQETWAGAANLSLPNWFTEGDAVWAETQQSHQGRGRITSFLEGYRALEFANRKFRYDKVRNGSLKDFVPDHYRLGYLLVQYANDRYGHQFWKEVATDAAAYKGIFYPFAKAMKRKSGLLPTEMYDDMWDDFVKDQLVKKGESIEVPVLIPQPVERSFTDYQYPHVVGDSMLIYFERSYDKIGRFYSFHLANKTISKLTTKGVSSDAYFAGNERYISWTEYTTDARWTDNNFSDIFRFDIVSGERKRITHKGKYFAPQSDPQGLLMICVKIDQNTQNTLCLFDATNGKLVKEFKHTGWFYTYPQFDQDLKSVVTAIRDEKGAMGIVQIDLSSGEERIIVPFLNRIIGVPEVVGDVVYYSASTEGVENIFSTNRHDGFTSQLTDEPNGGFQAAIGGEDLYYVTFTDKGHVIKTSQLATLVSSSTGPANYEFSGLSNLLDSIPDRKYTIDKYKTLAKSLNVHTWGLIYEDPEIIGRVLSNNVLNNVEFSAGVKYNNDNQNFRPFAQLSIAAWYPVIELQASTVRRSQVVEDVLRKWMETSLYGGLSVDWNLTSGSYLRILRPAVGINHSILTRDLDLTITSVVGQLTFEQQQIKARKNIFTHSGQYVNVKYNAAIDQYLAEQIQIRTGLALRGVGVNHNLIIEADMKSDLSDAEYQFSNGLNHRGYGVIPGNRVYRLSADYHFPLMYPDRGFAGLVYFYRIRANPFFEFSAMADPDQNQTYQTIGAEVVFDMNMVNEVPLSVGVRYSRPLDKSFSPSWEVFLPVYRF